MKYNFNAKNYAEYVSILFNYQPTLSNRISAHAGWVCSGCSCALIHLYTNCGCIVHSQIVYKYISASERLRLLLLFFSSSDDFILKWWTPVVCFYSQVMTTQLCMKCVQLYVCVFACVCTFTLRPWPIVVIVGVAAVFAIVIIIIIIITAVSMSSSQNRVRSPHVCASAAKSHQSF